MKEKGRAMEWFRAKHDELAETAQANLAAHDLEPGQEAYHLDSLHYATAEQMEAICPTGIDFDRYATLANGSVGYDEADAHWDDAAWWDEQARAMWDEVDGGRLRRPEDDYRPLDSTRREPFPDPTGRRRGTEATSRRRETEHGTNAARIPRIFF